MHKSELKSNGPQGLLPTEPQQQSSGLRMMRRLALLCCAGMLMLLALLLTGCGTTSTLQAEPPQPVLMPAISQPLPTVDYSLQAQQHIEGWRKSVTDMFKMSEL